HSGGTAAGNHASVPNSEAPNSQAHSPETLAPGGDPTATSRTGVTKITDIFGPGCGGLPTKGKGSPRGMVDDSVATAASNNPLLKTLAKALTAANLVDILNSVPTLTVFAPDDLAFQQWDAEHPGIITELSTAPDVVSPNSELAKILTYHVVGQRYDAAGLVHAGTVDTLEGAKITIGGTAAAPTVNGMPVVCGNIPTKNATVFVIGQVLPVPAF
ncbi:MAG: fasciclin domain-containing protein, partial [Pseudonocardiaceae bacterium]